MTLVCYQGRFHFSGDVVDRHLCPECGALCFCTNEGEHRFRCQQRVLSSIAKAAFQRQWNKESSDRRPVSRWTQGEGFSWENVRITVQDPFERDPMTRLVVALCNKCGPLKTPNKEVSLYDVLAE